MSQTFPTDKYFRRETYRGEDGFELPYRMYIPPNYDCGATYPLLLILHGAGERGRDNEEQISCNFNPVWENPRSPARRSIIIVPQCDTDKQWVYTPFDHVNYSADEIPESRELEAVMEIIKSVDREYNVDRSRIYVTGISMGGYGTWDMLMRHSSVFAAGMPVCGGGDPSRAKTLADIPIRTFHGALDDSVPPEGTREMYRAIKLCGKGKIYYREYPDMGHNVWDAVYSDPENLRWMFSKRKPGKVPVSGERVRRAGAVGAVLGVIGAIAFAAAKKRKKNRSRESK